MSKATEPAGWMVEISGADKFFYSEKSALNARKRYERDMDAEPGEPPYAVYKVAPQPAAHLTIPGALEWDGDNSTHGADGESRAHSESAYTAVDMTTAAADGFRDGLAAFSADGKRNVLAEVFFQKGDEPFICAVRGRICVEQLEAAQRDFRENLPDELEQGDGIYTFDFFYEKGQYDDMGRCEIAPGWGFDFVSYAAFEAADEEESTPAADEPRIDDIPDFTPGSGNKAKRRIAAIEAAKAESFPCWSCSKPVTMEERATEDGDCPHCSVELDLEDWPKAKVNKPKTCIECDQPYCHGVCVERGDQDYDRDQAAKGGEQ